MDNVGLFGKNIALDNLMIFGAQYVIYLAIILTLAFAIKGGTGEKKAFILTVFTLLISFLLIKIIHIFFFEPRPFVYYRFSPLVDNNPDASFPSRHSSIMSVIAFAYTYYKSKWALLFLFLMLWVGISRIYVGVHYPLDILGGFFVGIISLMLALQIKRLLKITFLSKSS